MDRISGIPFFPFFHNLLSSQEDHQDDEGQRRPSGSDRQHRTDFSDHAVGRTIRRRRGQVRTHLLLSEEEIEAMLRKEEKSTLIDRPGTPVVRWTSNVVLVQPTLRRSACCRLYLERRTGKARKADARGIILEALVRSADLHPSVDGEEGRVVKG